MKGQEGRAVESWFEETSEFAMDEDRKGGDGEGGKATRTDVGEGSVG